MAAYFQKPKIVVEESPWTAVLQGLPDMLLSFHQLNMHAQEKEKDRQFQESKMYLNDLMSSKKMMQQALLDSNKLAVTKGLAYDLSLDEITKPELKTSGSKKITSSMKNVLQNDIDHLTSVLDNINGEIRLANQGAMDAFTVDANASNLIDADELIATQKRMGMEEVPASYIKGVQNVLNTPEARKENAARRKVLTALNIFESKDTDPKTPGIQIDENAPGGPELLQALEAFTLDERSPQVANNLIKASSKHLEIKPFEISGEIWSPVGIGYHTTPEGKEDKKNNNIRQHPDDKYTGVWFRVEDKPGLSIVDKAINETTKDYDTNFRTDFKRLKASAKSLFPAKKASVRGKKQKIMQYNIAEASEPVTGSLSPTSLPEHKESFAKNLAMLFSGQYDPGSGTSIATVRKEWIKQAFKANDGWKDPVAAADAILLDPRFQELLNDPEAWKKAFNFKASGSGEVAFDRFFKEQSALYNTLLDYEYFLDQAEASGASTQLKHWLGEKVKK